MNKVMPKYFNVATCALFSITLLSSLALSSSSVSADDDSVVDEINITVPSSCNLTGIGNTSHTATINNGTYVSDIGTTTIKAFCNDQEGFAIYAIGYTDDADGKNVLTSSVLGSTHDIATGTGTSGNSQWAMKLSTQTSPEPDYPITIENNYNNYHTVPDDYELVAKRTASTDVGTNAIGSTLTSTYQVYISQTQSAGTYLGQVKYVLVHPNTAPEPIRDDQVEVIFHGNGLTFPGGGETNRVVYGTVSTPVYISTNPTILTSSNVDSDGVADGPYTDHEDILEELNFDGAVKIRVVLRYGLDGYTYHTGGIAIGPCVYNDEGDYIPCDENSIWLDAQDNILDSPDTVTFDFDGDTVYVALQTWDVPDNGNIGGSYGMYAQVYPIYETERSNTEEITTESFGIVSGAYAETTTWNGEWYGEVVEKYEDCEWGDEPVCTEYTETHTEYFENQDELISFIINNKSTTLGTTINLYAYNPFTIFYDGNGATDGTMSGFNHVIDDLDTSTVLLLAPNFKKTGYGFAGWSMDRNATVNSNSTIFGPNEIISGSELSFDSSRETTLYAVWVPTSGTMQSFDCSSLSDGRVTALSDSRDNNVYTVGKMQDGECWMMENLRLDAENSLDSTKAQGYGGVFSGLANSEDEHFSSRDTTANSLYSTSNIGDDGGAYLRFPRYNNDNVRFSGTSVSGRTLISRPTPTWWLSVSESDPTQWFSYGNYYTWAAAIANTTSFTSVTDVTTSICPANWHLPTASESDSLIEAFGGVASQETRDSGILQMYVSYPNNFVYSGYYINKGMQQYGNDIGLYWLATNYSSEKAYSLYLQNRGGSIYIHPSSNNMSKGQGYTVRCVADEIFPEGH